jgi:hypothetical protein
LAAYNRALSACLSGRGYTVVWPALTSKTP